MEYFLENSYLKATIKGFGAELKSIVGKADNQEYMWEANPDFWGKTSPILFPFIGKLQDAGYQYQGKRYTIEKHGFARDMEFCVMEQGQDRIVLALESNAETLEKFPFPFRLEVEYSLQEAAVKEQWRVHNMGTETMYFSIGGHPAFACPLKVGQKTAGTETNRGEKRIDCFVRLYGAEDKKTVLSTEIGVPNGLLTGNRVQLALDKGVLPITDHIFDHDALALVQEGITAVGILDKAGKEYVRLEADCPVWGIWSMPDNDAAYVCLEPWWGICDSKGYVGTLEERPFTNQVPAGDTWTAEFRIVV